MRRFSGISLLGVAAVLSMSVAAHASLSVQILNNVGTLYSETNNSPVTTSTASQPYGAAPGLPIVSQLTNGAQLTFSPTSDFYVRADNINGTQSQSVTFNGDLSFIVTSTTPIQLTVNISEVGDYQSGNSTTNVTGTIAVSDFYHVESTKQTNFSDSLTSSGSWSLTSHDTGFTGSYYTYLVSIDNILHAQVAATGPDSSAWVDKKQFIVTLTTDGSSGGGQPTPEPASLGVLALGGFALLARRRRA